MYIKNLPILLALLFIGNFNLFAQDEPFQLRQVACDLEQPWEITYGPDNHLWVTESRAYKLLRIEPNTGNTSVVLDASNLKNFPNNQDPWPQGGFTGVAVHPDLLNGKPYVYVAYTYEFNGCLPNDQGCFFKTKIVRYNYNAGSVSNPEVVLDNIPGSNDHNGGRLIITEMAGTPYLLYTVGDMGAGQFDNSERTNNAQDPNIYEGKTLRLHTEPIGGGANAYIPSNNPFGNAVWTLGHRNPQGLAVGQFGDIYAAEHGPWTDDEVNIINSGANYGHPLVSGFADGNYNGVKVGTGSLLPVINNEASNANGLSNYQDPIASYYAAPSNEVTDWYNYAITGTSPFPNAWLFRPSIAPSGIGYYGETAIPNWNNSLLLTSLKKATIYRQPLSANGQAIDGPAIPYFEGLGRFRDIAISPAGDKIYVVCDKYGATSGPTQGTQISPNNPGCVLEFEYAPNLVGCQNSYDGFTFIGDYNDAKYFISNDVSNWANGSSLAEFYTGYLASPNDQAENDFIQNYLQLNNEIAFIGVSDGNNEGAFELASEEPLTFNNFSGANSPIDNYGVMNFWDGSWSVNNLTTERRYIIEIPCTPVTSNLQLTCDNDINISIPTGSTTVQVSYAFPQGTTTCPTGGVSISKVTGPNSNASLSAGTYQVVYSATDDCGNVVGCDLTITVSNPTSNLQLTCDSDINVSIPAGSTTVQVSYAFPQGTTTCPTGGVNISKVSGPNSNASLSAGTYQVVHSATDDCGNVVGCDLTITVSGAPAVCNVAYSTGIGSVTVTGLTGAENAKLFDNNISAVWECNPWNGSPCTGNEVITGLPAGNYFLSVQSDVCSEWIPINVQGGGNCSLQGTVNNCTFNAINTTYDIFVTGTNTTSNTFSVEVYQPVTGLVVLDLDYGMTHTITEFFSSNSVSKTVWDTNNSNCTTTISGTCQPEQSEVTFDSCPQDLVRPIPSGANGIAVSWNEPFCISTCAGNGQMCVKNQTAGPANGDFLAAGTYTVTYQAQDGCGNTAICTFDIYVTSQAQCNVSITEVNGDLIITGLTSAENAKLFDANIDAAWTCNPWNGTPCTGNEVINNLPTGQYYLSVQSTVCNEWIPITVTGNSTCSIDASVSNAVCNGTTLIYDLFVTGTDTDDNFFNLNVQIAPQANTTLQLEYNQTHSIVEYIYDYDGQTIYPFDDYNSDCNDEVFIPCPNNQTCTVEAISSNGSISISGLTNQDNTKLFDANNVVVWGCNPWSSNNSCPTYKVVSGLTVGVTYYLAVQSSVCNEWIPITVQGGGGTDADGDGVPDAQDCAPNDATLPTTPGTACNDFDSNTTNDMIQNDGCICEGTPIGGGCNVIVTETDFGELTVTGLSAAENTKLFDSSASSSGLVWECNPWASTCSNTEVITGLTPGEQYYLSVQSNNCSEWIPVILYTVPFGEEYETEVLFQQNNNKSENKFSILNLFPNPATTEAFVIINSTFEGNFDLQIFDVMGRLKSASNAELEKGSNSIQLDLIDLNTGMYHLVIQDKTGRSQTIRFVVNK